MELEQFIESVLTQVVNGVTKAQKSCAEKGAWVNPGVAGGSLERVSGDWEPGVEQLQFDVSVVVAEENESGGKAGIRVWGVGIGAEGRRGRSRESTSRVSFGVRVAFPKSDCPEDFKQD